MRLLTVIFIFIVFSCTPKKSDKVLAVQKDSLKPYQQYCLNILTKATSNDIGYEVSDSFHLWADGYVDKEWKPFYITKTINDGLYTYIFWEKNNDSFLIYKETQVSKAGFVGDSLYDANGDSYKDFVITDNSMNGQCQPKFSQLFCFDKNKGKFIEVEKINSLPNITFQPKDRTVSGVWECKMTRDVYKFKWTNSFQLDTIYYKTINL